MFKVSAILESGLLILQYCLGIGSIGNTFSSIARVLQYILKIGIGIANTFFNIGNLFIPIPIDNTFCTPNSIHAFKHTY